jgi:hypothetical protein
LTYGIILLVFFRPEKPDELPDADDSEMKDDNNEIDEEMVNKVFELSIETIEIKFYI